MASGGNRKHGRNKRGAKAAQQLARTTRNKSRAVALAAATNPGSLKSAPSPGYTNPRRTKGGTWLWDWVRDRFGRKEIVRCSRPSLA